MTFLGFYATVFGMGNPAGVRRDFVALEQRRREAAELLRQGVHPAEVARRVRVHRQSVGRWAKQLERGGLRALKRSGRAGRKARLRPGKLAADRARLEAWAGSAGVRKRPVDLGGVAHLIESECGVPYHPGHAWRILRQLGWSCQRPTGRARERAEAESRRWKQKRWPEIKKKPKKKAASSSSSMKAD